MSVRVFLADDHGIVRDGMRLLLEMHSRFKVVGEAGNGRDAVVEVSELVPDVVILDISMPLLNGIEATRQICAINPMVSVLILSMYSDKRYISQALSAGARGYLLKTSLGNELVEAIDHILLGHRYLSQKIEDALIDDYLDHIKENDDEPLSLLSPREREVTQLVVEGYSSADIADILSLAPSTVDTYRSRVMQKLRLTTLPDLIKFSIQNGLIEL